ncbi:class I SAM-dependent methyltransferase [Williamsia sp. CHRR-6]|uniref:class I SAM-dependent methyltransferase n=1 Tax=Williamsia sp. CHRR-6 TaxID=2835871 RepID=UPI001BDB452C|nr:class I SAM-dependent methyltransferase [Williamsia sp. CHRR-6]MBT0566930.1 class I SAM-dependent methyltransferase [Williamsia sp. CHRR-6]
MPSATAVQGQITRGTTNPNRLRRVDRWMAGRAEIVEVLAAAPDPLAVDLGYGNRPDTAVEMAARLRAVEPRISLVGLEIDPQRVVADRDGVRFGLGGFELAGLRPHLVRAFNVLRQYDESEVLGSWAQMQAALAPGGLIVEGTCDEIGRRCTWVLLDEHRPRSLTLAWAPGHTDRPSELAPRLPKALIHHNVDGRAIFALLRAADRCWDSAAPYAPYGPRIRWLHARAALADLGVPVEQPRRRTRDNVLTVPWDHVAR